MGRARKYCKSEKNAFDDNHDSGIFSWDYLYELGVTYEERWQQYLDRLEAGGHKRKPDS
jgi:DUF971 family protein